MLKNRPKIPRSVDFSRENGNTYFLHNLPHVRPPVLNVGNQIKSRNKQNKLWYCQQSIEFWYPTLFNISWCQAHNQIHSRHMTYASHVKKIQTDSSCTIASFGAKWHMGCYFVYLEPIHIIPGNIVVTKKIWTGTIMQFNLHTTISEISKLKKYQVRTN